MATRAAPNRDSSTAEVFINQSWSFCFIPIGGRLALVRKEAANPRHLVALLLADEFSIFEVGVAAEVFGYDRSAYVGSPWYRFVTCGVHPGPIRSETGFSLLPSDGLAPLRRASTIIVPPINEAAVGPAVLEELRRAHRRGARLISLCTGVFVLAKAGLLDGRIVTTHWGSVDLLATSYPTVKVDPDVLYIDDGDILTSAGSAASMDLCLYVVRRDYGADVANTVARRLVVPPHRAGGQAQFIEAPMPAAPAPDPFADTLIWVQEHLGESITVELLASRAAMSPRTFARRFRAGVGTTPHQWLSRQRILLAQRLLESTDMSVDDVAWRCGLGTAANLRVKFAASVRASPTAYRRTFRSG
jgi:AraC family transcriptional activator FtrA